MQRDQQQTPRPQRVRVAGRLDSARRADGLLTLVTQAGEGIPLRVGDESQTCAESHDGVVVVGGTAHFDLSGSLLHVDVDLLQLGDEQDLRLWSQAPQPLFGGTDREDLRQPQGPTSGLNAIFGRWPGDETDEEIFALLEEIS